jgi:putative tryptophan/tyrosine transport system substrate-binding protein
MLHCSNRRKGQFRRKLPHHDVWLVEHRYYSAKIAVDCFPKTRGPTMRRRDFIAALGGVATALPITAQAQQRALPVVGYLGVGTPLESEPLTAAFIGGLNEAGYAEGRNVAVEFHWARNDANRLAGFAADFVRRRVAIIAAAPGTAAAVAAKSATSTIPIVFATGADPVKLGLVASLNRPGGNATGVSFRVTEIMAKRVEILHELTPKTTVFGMMSNPAAPQAEDDESETRKAADILKLKLLILRTSNESDIETAFATLVQEGAGGLLTGGDSLFANYGRELVVLAARHAMPWIGNDRAVPEAGGLMSYGGSISDACRLAGTYAGRILKGERPADLPVQQSTRIEMVLNLRTARALGIEVPTVTLLRADEVIE